MAGAATDGLFVAHDSPVHRLDAAAKVAACVTFTVAVVLTPRTQLWAFGAHLGVVLATAWAARLSPRLLARRARIELPFVGFALLLPLVGTAPHTEVLGLSLSVPGLWAAWSIVVKGVLGVLAAIVLTATTTVADLLHGLDRLRVPTVIVAIAGFMVRYLDVIAADAERLRVARVSRGDDPRWLWQVRALVATSGALFVRSFERGERVHLAMRARGYTGTMPRLARAAPGPAALAAAPALAAMAIASVAVLA